MHNCILVLGGRELQNSFILTQIKDWWSCGMKGLYWGNAKNIRKQIQVL